MQRNEDESDRSACAPHQPVTMGESVPSGDEALRLDKCPSRINHVTGWRLFSRGLPELSFLRNCHAPPQHGTREGMKYTRLILGCHPCGSRDPEVLPLISPGFPRSRE